MRITAPISFAGSQFTETRRVCASFSSDDEYRVLLPSIKDGFTCGRKAVRGVSPRHPTIMIGGVLQRNPSVAPPGEFLREFHRRAGRSTSTSAGS